MIYTHVRQAKRNKNAIDNHDELHQLRKNNPARTLVDNRQEAIAQRQIKSLMASQGEPQPKASAKANHSGLPEQLKSGIEHLSGLSMDNIKVHYNSAEPRKLQAHAYAQGENIHLAPGQEKHLPHEAWHVVQQKQGRVKPTAQLKNQVNINDNNNLEQEADVMGAKAMQLRQYNSNQNPKRLSKIISQPSIQFQINYNSRSRGLNGGKKIKNREHLIITLIQRWQQMPPQIIEKTVDSIIASRGRKWKINEIYKFFNNKINKQSHVPISTKGRPPTLYTYTHTRAKNKISKHGIPQGPHTLGFSAIRQALYTGHGGVITRQRFNKQISSPGNWWAMVQAELSGSQLADSDLGARLNKARLSYQEYYGQALDSLNELSQQSISQEQKKKISAKLILLMEHLMQLDPYATYAWANKNSTPDVGGHGETTNINDDKNIDRGGNFSDPDRFEAYIDKRRKLI